MQYILKERDHSMINS